MLLFSNAKINLGLNVLSKRSDGFHDIETVMVPIDLSDMLELVENNKPEIVYSNTGIQVDCPLKENLVFKAWKLLKDEYDIPYIKIHLHKFIPHGAGLGGGSSNAAFMLRGLNNCFKMGLDDAKLEKYAAMLGSDCSFFIRNVPCLATGRGEVLKETILPIGFYMVLLYPGFPVSTKDAYNGIIPQPDTFSPAFLLTEDPENWKDKLVNHFEKTVFLKHPELSSIKQALYDEGAFYASMSGSGSAMYGLFREKPVLSKELTFMRIWEGEVRVES